MSSGFTLFNSFIGTSASDSFTAPIGFHWTIKGLLGDDKLIGSPGNDTIIGGDGNDYIDDGTDGCDSLVGGNGDDILISNNDLQDTLIGGSGNDRLWAQSGNNYFNGGAGNDYISTGGFNYADTLIGGGGKDTMDAGDGNDYLFGGNGKDSLTGGLGNDEFYYKTANEGIDIITDFGVGNDTIVVEDTGFNGITSVNLTYGTFASTTSSEFIYDTTTGNFFFDSDGTGITAQKQIAVLVGIPPLIASQIIIV